MFSIFRLIGSTLATVAISQGGNVTMFAQGVSLGVDERISKSLPEEQCFCLFVCLFVLLFKT